MMSSPRLLRRQFLALPCGIAGATAAASLGCSTDLRDSVASGSESGYGPLRPVKDETTGLPLLHLPAGFTYLSFGWKGDLLRDGLRTPGAHDGMAAFSSSGSRIRLVRNHEVREGPAFAPGPVYDRAGGGGTTTIEFDSGSGSVVEAWASLAGTAVNCAGGPTPWGSWLSCEETVSGPGGEEDFGMPHGYVFEVPSDGSSPAEPYRSMGRFVHEAVAVDPATGIVYETEDRSEAGFYRFTPRVPGHLADGGRLEMLALANRPGADTRKGQTAGAWQAVRWVPIHDPDPDPITDGSVRTQGLREGGAKFARLEGTWHGNGRIYIVSTNGGDAEAGQVWEYDPSQERLALLYESPGAEVLDMPDNICVSPRGGLVLCEDGGGEDHVRGLTTSGEIFPFAKNNVILDGERNGLEGDFRDGEFAGATYSPDGRWLFFNAQTPGITFAVTGPWGDGLI